MSTSPVISVQSLEKRYDKVEAVKGIDFQVNAGEVESFEPEELQHVV